MTGTCNSGFRPTNAALTIDPKGNSVVTVFDGASRATQFQQHLRQAGQGQNPPAPNQTLLPGSAGTIVTTLILDGNSRQTQLIDDRDDVTRWEFDTLDRETAMIFQDGSTRQSQYDEASDVIVYIDENGTQFDNVFDSLGRKFVVNITLAAGVADTTTYQSFQYDGLSRTTGTYDSNTARWSGTSIYFDSIDRVLEDSQATYFSGVINTRDVTNTQFASYPVTQFQFPGSSGRKLDNAFDALYRRITVADHGGTTIAAWQFFGPGRVAEVALGNGLTCTWMNNARKNSAVQGGTPGVPNPPWVALPAGQSADRLGYDGAGRGITKRYLLSGTGESGYSHPSAVVGFTTAFDRASNKLYERALHAEERSSLYEPFDSNQIPQGGYDSLDRLLQYQRGVLSSSGGCGGNGGGSIAAGGAITLPNTDSQRSYLLDSLGNWRNTAFTPVGGSSQTEVRQHNGLNEITRRSNPTISELINPTYDLNGNLTFDGTLTYQWDALNRLVAVSNGETPVGAYWYDALNRRVRKAIGDTNTDFIYFGWRCLEDRNPVGGEDSTDAPIAQYLWGIYLDELIQLKLLVTTNDFEPNTILYPLQDLLYRTTGLADTSSPPVVLEAYDTDAYGNTLIFRNTSGSTVEPITWTDSDTQVALPIAPTCPFIFTGQRFDAETGLYYYKRRYYLAVLGRFLSRDPIGFAGACWNLYEYTYDSPAKRVDPSGLQVLEYGVWRSIHSEPPAASPSPAPAVAPAGTDWLDCMAACLNDNDPLPYVLGAAVGALLIAGGWQSKTVVAQVFSILGRTTEAEKIMSSMNRQGVKSFTNIVSAVILWARAGKTEAGLAWRTAAGNASAVLGPVEIVYGLIQAAIDDHCLGYCCAASFYGVPYSHADGFILDVYANQLLKSNQTQRGVSGSNPQTQPPTDPSNQPIPQQGDNPYLNASGIFSGF